MQNNQNNIYVPASGLDRDTHPIRLKDGSYTFAKNIAIEDSSGNGIPVIQNEPSTILCKEFKDGRNVIGFKFEPSLRKTFLFIINTISNVSEIGYISHDNFIYNSENEAEFCNCEPSIDLGDSLEDIIQYTENCSYTQLINDGCDEADGCLQFSINHPIKSSNIVFKNEQCGKRLYWTDGYNPPRYLHLEELEEGNAGEAWKSNKYYHKGNLVCQQEIDLIQTCINCDALKIFPDFSIPCIDVKTIVLGGNLFEGTYEFFIAFCDEEGNEISDYYAHTFPVPIFNFEELTVESLDLSRQTNYGLNIEISYLDTEFSFYKLACVFKSALGQEESVKDLGVFPINQTSVTISSLYGFKDKSLNSVLTKKLKVDIADKLSEANGYLFLGGLTSKNPINIQPIANLVGPFLKWETLIAHENFYKNSINSQKFRGYMRDENYALSLSFGLTDGTETNEAILINRAPYSSNDYTSLGVDSPSDLSVLVNNSGDTPIPIGNDKNVASIIDANLSCFDTNRVYRWQYYNTAVNKGLSLSGLNTEIDLDNTSGLIKRTIKSVCSSINLNNLNIFSNIDFKISGEFQFFDSSLEDFLNTKIEDYRNPSNPYYSSALHEYLKLDRYQGLGCYYALGESGNCNNFNLLKEELFFSDIDFDSLIPTYLDFSSYTYKDLDYVETQFGSGIRVADSQISEKFGLKGYPQVQLRIDFKIGETCDKPESTKILESTDIESTNGYVFKNMGTLDVDYLSKLVWQNYESDIISDTINYPIRPIWSSGGSVYKIAIFPRAINETWNYARVTQQFTTKIAKNAIWFTLNNLSEFPYIQINFKSTLSEDYEGSEQNSMFIVTRDTDVTLNRINKVRLSIFDSCSVNGSIKQAIYTEFFNIHEEPLIDFKTIIEGLGLSTNNPYLLTLDSPIQNVKKFKVNFVRYFADGVTLTENTTTPEEFRYMEKFEQSGQVYYRARNIDPNGNPATSCIPYSDDGTDRNWAPVAWSETGDIWDGNTCMNPTSHTPGTPMTDEKLWTTTSLENSFMVTQRGKEVDFYDLSVVEGIIEKNQEYSKDCYYKDISGDFCDYTNYENGIFGYNESTETYPDNIDLFNSGKTDIELTEEVLEEAILEATNSSTDFDIFEGVSFKTLFNINFGSNSNFVEKEKLDFRCKPIRNFRFPDNSISPFVYNNESLEFDDTYIHPLGVSIDSKVINTFLNLAVKLGQITQQQRDSIVYFKLNRSYRGVNRTVLSKGFLSDVIKYSNSEGQEWHFSNFPYNSLNDKDLIYQNRSPIKHQYNKLGNNMFTFISPEVMINNSLSPTELKVDGYMYGTGVKQVDEVKGHSKMVVLSQQAKDLAVKLGKAEASFELAMSVADGLLKSVEAFDMFYGWVGVGINVGGMINFSVGMATLIAFESKEFDRKLYTYAYKWMESFKNAGKGINFAHYIGSSVLFNNLYTNPINSNESLRGIKIDRIIKDGNHKINIGSGSLVSLNNIDREKSLFIYLGANYKTRGITYPGTYTVLDNSNSEPSIDKLRTEEKFTASNLYAGLKIYNPAQYGKISNITWVPTPGCLYLKDDVNFLTFGGDTFISRFSYKKKYNFYLATALNQVDFEVIKYSRLDNIGRNKYFIDYDSEVADIGYYGLPYNDSAYNLQFKNEHGKYVDSGRFYHYEYGFHNQLVESEINCWTRVGLTQPKDNFYPNFQDYMAYTQETFVSIREPERFLFNSVFSNEGVRYVGRFLPDNYEPKFYNCVNNSPSGIIRSQVDASEKRKVDPWLIFKPLDSFNFKASYGKFISLKSIESQQLLAFFEHKLVLLNRIDEIRERVTPETVELSKGIFSVRPMEFHSTDNGYAGTQHSEIVSTEFGHFYVDARRGQVFQIEPNGDGMSEVTLGLRNWFKEHLPFKILRGNIEGITDLDLDNKFKGLGISLGWDSKFKRLFLTKLDYIVNPSYIGKLEYRNIESSNSLIETKIIVNKDSGEEVSFSNRDIFTPAHFTLAYNPLFKSWISYYSFYPNYYISYDNYFRTGLNESNTNLVYDKVAKIGLWSHLLTNKSYGVFYGVKYPWSIEVVTKEQFNQKILSSVNYWMDSLVYHNDYDYAQDTNIGMDSAIVYNNTNNSGKLNLIRKEENNRFQYTQYPKYNQDSSSDILTAFDEGGWRFNDFFNRTINENNNVPIWKYDINAIDKFINPTAISFKRTWLDRLRGDYFFIRFEGGSDTRFKQIFKWNYNNEQIVI